MLLESYYVENKDKLIATLTRFTGDADASQDAIQNAFLKALQSRETVSYMQEKALWSWLYTTAKNSFIDEKRKTSRIDPLDDYDVAESVSEIVDMIAVRAALDKLPPHLMHIVSLRYYGGLNATEIGRLQGIPPATVRSQLRVAIAIMRKYVS